MRYRRKKDWIIPYVKGKKVLDLGCVQHSIDETKKAEWLHGIIRKHAASVIGVDYLASEVVSLKEQGYDVICANVETMELRDKFEAIVAGDIIEHLANCGKFMERAKDHLAPGGLLLITTPNPMNILRLVQLIAKGRIVENAEHTCWFTSHGMSELARRYGLKIADTAYVDDSHLYYKPTFLFAPFLLLNYILCLIRPQVSETICFVLRGE